MQHMHEERIVHQVKSDLLQSDFEPRSITGTLYSRNILVQTQVWEIEALSRREERIGKLVSFLKSKDQRALQIFVEAVRMAHFTTLAAKIERRMIRHYSNNLPIAEVRASKA